MERPISQQSSGGILTDGARVTDRAVKAGWRDYWTLTKPGINASNLMAAFAGFWLAGYGAIDYSLLLAMLAGTALVIAGGCSVNNYIDRDIDPLMKRTRDRPVAAGRIQPLTALWYGIGLFLAGVVLLVALVNPLTAFLAAIGFVTYVFLYSAWTKRTTHWNTVVGSVSGAVPPLIGWAAVTGGLEWPAWVLFLFMFVWQPAHFFALAMMKADDYREAGIPMLPVVKGFRETKWQTLIFIILVLPVSLLLFATGVVGWLYLVTALVLGVGYLYLALAGWTKETNDAWARKMFLYSLLYLTVMQLAMFIDPILFR
ncbi:heme o synthase [Desmospora profundinema]|uniref:Protoheme IX farnesyltransferase n=1 Tax=Desmospora profundinema TaxID=1571184 RepID=A0ABU1IM40_9BACL|nr:heme o synthase [Desmospora profundinema]MDR6225840.1 protoheme IX farnesyltransferase [Desmospora profundinema]